MIAKLPFLLAARLQLFYVMCVLAPIVAFWMGSRWPQTPSIVWNSPGESSASGENIHSIAVYLSTILNDWRGAEGEIARMVKEGEESYQRVSAGHRELLDRFEIIEAGIEGGELLVAGEKGVADELRVAKKLWKEVSDLKEVMEAGRKTFVDTTSKYHDALDRFVALENRVDVVEAEIKGVVARHEGSSSLVVNLIAASATNNEKAHTRFVALETRVEEVAGEVSGIVEQQSSGEDVSTLIESLVEEAISKEQTSKADFALHSAGASIMLSLTSPTREIWPKNMRDRLIGLTMDIGFGVGSKAEEALSPDMHAGKCWPFNGQEGQLGVALAQRIYVEEITVHHISPKAAVYDIASAPKEMEVWGKVEGAENAEKVARWRQSNPDDADTKVVGTFIRLSAFSYDITIGKEAQTFPVDEAVADLEVDFGIVLLQVLSNWGGEYTCLYRLGVHGRRVAVGFDIESLAVTSPSVSTPPPTSPSSSSYTSASSLSTGRDSASE